MIDRLIRGGVAALALAVAVTSAGEAQRRSPAPQGLLGINGSVLRPVGEFRDFVDWGGGLGLYGVFHLDRGGTIGIRLDGSFMVYGHESFEAPFSETIHRVRLEVNTDNAIVSLGIGPQLSLDLGRLRPYAYGTAGFSYFATVSSVRGTDSSEGFASTTNFDDATLALGGGGGLLVRVKGGPHPVSIDLAVQGIYNGEAEYLREGGIRENANGSLTLLPIVSQANNVTFKFGVAVGL
ncbi:MAG: hypothetical protein ACE5PT_03590 [Gemmatimonadales bacterium]